jgi:DNA-binding CsgD family transcriptional regulator
MVDPVEIHPNGAARVERLSAREREVLELASSGLTNRQIAIRLRLTIHAVKFHLAAIYRKLGVANRTEAAFVYLNRPLVEPASEVRT